MADDLSGFEQPSELHAEAYVDMAMLEAWIAAGFSRQEAMMLLVNIKTKNVNIYIHQLIEES